jgi:mRNA interferase MazF
VKGKIVLIPFPFTDLTSTKLRPALVLTEGEKDCVVAFISSKVPSELSSTELSIQDHEEFADTGLKRTSVKG